MNFFDDPPTSKKLHSTDIHNAHLRMMNGSVPLLDQCRGNSSPPQIKGESKANRSAAYNKNRSFLDRHQKPLKYTSREGRFAKLPLNQPHTTAKPMAFQPAILETLRKRTISTQRRFQCSTSNVPLRTDGIKWPPTRNCTELCREIRQSATQLPRPDCPAFSSPSPNRPLTNRESAHRIN
jgi:hypothetical protein